LSTNQFNFVVRDVTRLSQAVGSHLEKLLSNHVILLDAPMGAGKTTFVSALSALLGSMITPSSPTFSICNEYPLASPVAGYSQIVHMDLYRFKSIEEILASGIEDYLSYTSMDLGRSGGASVNNYNGNLVYTHTDVSLPGNRMPMTISHVYNADQKASQVGYGSGWRLNLSQTLTPETIQGVSYMKYIDGDGTIHHFLVQSNKYYLQTPGLYLELVKNSDNTYTMKDTQNNQLKFSSAGNLIEIKNRLGDKITLGYSNNRITTVTDGAGRVAHLTYNASNILTKITDPAGRSSPFLSVKLPLANSYLCTNPAINFTG